MFTARPVDAARMAFAVPDLSPRDRPAGDHGAAAPTEPVACPCRTTSPDRSPGPARPLRGRTPADGLDDHAAPRPPRSRLGQEQLLHQPLAAVPRARPQRGGLLLRGRHRGSKARLRAQAAARHPAPRAARLQSGWVPPGLRRRGPSDPKLLPRDDDQLRHPPQRAAGRQPRSGQHGGVRRGLRSGGVRQNRPAGSGLPGRHARGSHRRWRELLRKSRRLRGPAAAGREPGEPGPRPRLEHRRRRGRRLRRGRDLRSRWPTRAAS